MPQVDPLDPLVSQGAPRRFPVEQGEGFQVMSCPRGRPATQERAPELGTRGQSRTPGGGWEEGAGD